MAAYAFPGAAGAGVAPARDVEGAYSGDSIAALGWNGAGDHLAAGNWDGAIRVWQAAAGGPPTNIALHPVTEVNVGSPVLDVQWSPDGAHIMAATVSGAVKLWSLTTNTVTDIAMHAAAVKSIGWVHDKNALVTGSWDRTMKVWDCRTPTPQASVAISDRCVSMDVGSPVIIMGTGDDKISVYNIGNLSTPYRLFDTPLSAKAAVCAKQTRSVRLFQNKEFFVISSAGGRCAVRAVDASKDTEPTAGVADKRYPFSFRCHRQKVSATVTEVYPVNALDTCPIPAHQHVLMTGGGDGSVSTWDWMKRDQNMTWNAPSTTQTGGVISRQPVVAARWNPTGTLIAYATAYDWSKGAEHFVPSTPSHIYVRQNTMEHMVKKR